MTCDRVFDLTIDFLEGTLDGDANAAVVDHVAGCSDCRRLIVSLRHSPPEDPALTAAILRRTSDLARPAPLWRRLLERPRIALEGAFVATVILVLPWGALHGGTSAQAVDAIRRLARVAWPRADGTFSPGGASVPANDATQEKR